MKTIKGLLKRLVYKLGHPIIRFFWWTARPGTRGARAILRRKGEVLLVKNIGVPYWSLPGGGGGRLESAEGALRRELHEELGVEDLKIDYLLGTYRSDFEGKKDVISIFVCFAPSFYHREEWEIDEACWFPIKDLPENLSPATRRRLKEYKNGERDLIGEW